ncbi:BPL-N domain-containing protein [Bremerella alba]|uniref:Biotin-protein ligase N-terminal domain-containing protein n=1 Tax=Bremerella alba TaxID=980252 RepID=A0A7V8V275_9BACT|nr:BPL-N domain-containing protein [Bremerella alba]MBA2113562.1 hypothetical protein [Bremerella alba]
MSHVNTLANSNLLLPICVIALTLAVAMPVVAQTSVVTETGPQIRVAVYSHSNGKGNGPTNLKRILIEETGFKTTIVSPAQIRDGVLSDFDVLIMPGGSGSKQAEMLEDVGCEVVKNFVRDGGGYVGICAGSYLASSHYSWSLGLINAKVWDRSHWARGTGTVSLDISPAGCKLLNTEEAELDCYYGQGPLLVPDNKSSLPGYEVLASYGTEIAKKGAPEGSMVGTHAIVRSIYGQGRVICFSPHPETSSGPNSIMAEGVRWAGSGQVE